jgi:hypothetical protein
MVHGAIVVGKEALVGVTGHICAPSSPCVSNANPNLGIPSSTSQFAAAYRTAVASGTSSGNTVMSPLPCNEIGGKWYVTLG